MFIFLSYKILKKTLASFASSLLFVEPTLECSTQRQVDKLGNEHNITIAIRFETVLCLYFSKQSIGWNARSTEWASPSHENVWYHQSCKFLNDLFRSCKNYPIFKICTLSWENFQTISAVLPNL
jgi:hypothetical protein